jgi:fructose-bisphosphate aldolase class I
MTTTQKIAQQMTTFGKGILAADESIGTMSSRLEDAGVNPTAQSRRDYRELLVSAADLADGVSGIIFCDETLNQTFADGTPFPEACRARGILPGIKVDTGAKDCPGLPGETITEGLEGLAGRLTDYAKAGAAFAKWRAVFTITDTTPSRGSIEANANALARYAAACQEAGLVPIVEPEVLTAGAHGIGQCAEVTAAVHQTVREHLALLNVDLAGIVLKPNMVTEGSENPHSATPEEVAAATVDVLRSWPGDLAGVAFLSGGQPAERATANLAAMQSHDTPWPLTFSFGRALVSPALAAWHGQEDRVGDGQAALSTHVAANAAAVRMRGRLQSV